MQRDPYDETTRPQAPLTSAYEKSKTRADVMVEQAVARGLPAIFMHPSAVYGPMGVTPTGTNRFLADLLNNRVPILLPGGLPLILNDDLAQAQLLAEAKATVGARYLVARSGKALSRLTRRPPQLTQAELNVLCRTGKPDTARITRELGWRPWLLTWSRILRIRSGSVSARRMRDCNHAKPSSAERAVGDCLCRSRCDRTKTRFNRCAHGRQRRMGELGAKTPW